MGVWDYISWTSDSLRRNTPDLTIVKGWWSGVYGFGSAAATKVDSAVRNNVSQTLVTNLAKNTAIYGGKEVVKSFVPGGPVLWKIVSSSVPDGKKFEGQELEVKALQAKVVKLEEDIKQLAEIQEKQKPCADVKSEGASDFNSKAYQKPEDVIRVFMMKESIGRLFLDDLKVPEVIIRRKNHK